MKKVIILSLLSISIPSIVFAALIVNLNYWYSDSSYIGRWSSNPYVQYVDLDGTIPGYSDYGYHARQQWNSAGVTNYYTTYSPDIKIYFGEYASIKAIQPSFYSGSAGATYYNAYADSNREYYYNGSRKYGYVHQKTTNIYIKQMDGKSSNSYKKTTTHELGHALGWRGHSNNSSDIMYGQSGSTTTLTSRDKNHLNQIN